MYYKILQTKPCSDFVKYEELPYYMSINQKQNQVTCWECGLWRLPALTLHVSSLQVSPWTALTAPSPSLMIYISLFTFTIKSPC